MIKQIRENSCIVICSLNKRILKFGIWLRDTSKLKKMDYKINDI